MDMRQRQSGIAMRRADTMCKVRMSVHDEVEMLTRSRNYQCSDSGVRQHDTTSALWSGCCYHSMERALVLLSEQASSSFDCRKHSRFEELREGAPDCK